MTKKIYLEKKNACDILFFILYSKINIYFKSRDGEYIHISRFPICLLVSKNVPAKRTLSYNYQKNLLHCVQRETTWKKTKQNQKNCFKGLNGKLTSGRDIGLCRGHTWRYLLLLLRDNWNGRGACKKHKKKEHVRACCRGN